MEELAAWRHLDACYDQMKFGLRIGPRPHWIASTTPKPRLLIKKFHRGEVQNVVRTHATMYDNPYIDPILKQELEDAYAGTSLGAQELYGRLLEEDENAFWRREHIERGRVDPDRLPKLIRKTVGVDPSGGAGEQGIVVTAKSEQIDKQHHGFVLADYSCHLSPDGWGRRTVQAAIDFEADDICVEVNYGGDQAIAVIGTAMEKMGITIPVRKVRASTGKAVRARPVSALSEQERWHHVGTFEALEDQLTTWYPELGWSPDRLDGMVWGPWHMKLVKTFVGGQGTFGTEQARKRIA
jgi:phage terminase large subunit-like protein